MNKSQRQRLPLPDMRDIKGRFDSKIFELNLYRAVISYAEPLGHLKM